MSIDIERLKVDADYWDECDPSDGEANYYEPIYADHEAAWVRIFNGGRHYFLNHGWVNADAAGDDMGDVETMIPRPTKQSQQWEELIKMIDEHAPYTSDELAKSILAKYELKERTND